MTALNINALPKIPISDKKISVNNSKSNDNDSFKDILKSQFSYPKETINIASSSKDTKLDKIKQKIQNKDYLSSHITEIIAEKLLNGWA